MLWVLEKLGELNVKKISNESLFTWLFFQTWQSKQFRKNSIKQSLYSTFFSKFFA